MYIMCGRKPRNKQQFIPLMNFATICMVLRISLCLYFLLSSTRLTTHVSKI